MRPIIPNLGKLCCVEMPEASKYQRLNRGSFSKIHCSRSDGTLVAQEWLYCREYFQDESAGIRRFLFCHKQNKCKNIALFIHKIENKLNLTERSIIGPTQRNNISWIRVCSWWTCTSMKRSLFTLLLRCGQNYKIYQDNFDESLFSIMYTKETKYAVQRFLDGHTRYTGKKKGWYKQFSGNDGITISPPSKEIIDKLLIRPMY